MKQREYGDGRKHVSSESAETADQSLPYLRTHADPHQRRSHEAPDEHGNPIHGTLGTHPSKHVITRNTDEKGYRQKRKTRLVRPHRYC
jgi:hypothetical protein